MSEAEQGRVVEFAIGGMTCAACSTRLEKVLNRQAGMQANVNLAAERARIRLSGAADEAAVVARAMGYANAVLNSEEEDLGGSIAPQQLAHIARHKAYLRRQFRQG
mgnify:CR=1 FL=1